jgi:hypothetical protein
MGLFPELDYYLLSLLFVVALLAAALVVFFREKHNVQVVRSAYIMVGLLIIFMPAALHPWYVILIVPFLSFFPSVAWLMIVFKICIAAGNHAYLGVGCRISAAVCISWHRLYH